MSEETAGNSNQQTIVIALVAIAVLLAAIVGVLVYQQTKAIPEPTGQATAPANTATNPTGTGTTPGASTQAPAAFDAKTATKLPAGMTPEQAVKAYHEDVVAGKFDDAFKLLPIDKQESYGSASAYTEQVKAYGITSYEIGKAVSTADSYEVAATQVTPQMPITYTWSFKKVGDQWYVASRVMGGSTAK